MTTHDRPDWNRIVDENGARVVRIAMRILGSVHDAEDVAQDVFAEAFRVYKSERVQSWPGLLVRLATLRAIDRRKRSRPVKSLTVDDHTTNVGPSDTAVANELASWLRKAINQLPEQQAAVFSLTYFEQLARDEIASSLGISAEAVSTALYKARQRLMSQLTMASGRDRK